MCMHEVQELVEIGSKEFLNEEYDNARNNFKLALKILEISDLENVQNVQYMIQYLLSITLLQFNKIEDLLKALEILINLEKSMESKYPIVYNGLAKAYIKLYRFNLALNEIKRGFDIINKGIDFETFTAPPTCIEKEATKDGLLLSLLELQETASKWRCPDAKCALENCQNIIPHCPISKDIYYRSERETSLKKLMELRKNYFGPLIDEEYRIDFENKKIEDACQFNRFLLEILYEYIKSKRIVCKTKLISKWHETKLLLADSPEIQTFLDVNIINLLLKHTKLVMVGDYICIPEALGEVLEMFENELIESYKALTSEIFEIERAQSTDNNMLSSENEEDSCTEEKSPEEYLEVSDNSLDSYDKNSNMNSDNNMKENVRKKLSFVPSENEYFVNNNYPGTDENEYAIAVFDDKLNDKTSCKQIEQTFVDSFVQKYFNNPLEKFHPQNLSTILVNVLSNDNMNVEDKYALLEEFYYSVVQDTIRSSQKYINEENYLKSQSKKAKQYWATKCNEVQSETLPSEKIKDEQHYQLLLKNQDKKIKALTSERQKSIEIKQQLDNKINCLSDKLIAMHKDNHALKKEKFLKSLELEYFHNKFDLQEAYYYTHAAVVLLSKINNFIKKYCGLNIDSDLNEWSSTYNKTLNAIQELQLEFVRVQSWIESMKVGENLLNVNMNYIPQPKVPSKPCSSIVIEAFTALLYKHTTNLSQDLSGLLSILLSYSTSDISELIPSHLSTLRDYLLHINNSKNNTNDKLSEARNNVEKPEEVDLKQISETIDNFNQILQSCSNKQLGAENTQIEDAPTNDIVKNNNVLEISNDNKPTLGMPITIASNLFMKREDSMENKTHETSDTTIKEDNINIEGKNKETEIDLTDELINIPLKNNDHHFENLNVKFDNKSSLSYYLKNEFIQDPLNDQIKNIFQKKDEENLLSTDSNKTVLPKESCSFM
ncbi:PREDICTED: uncharacterized protein LOC106789624 [Polistes canadensis]|uniref:uncharacterized protein LOC106789624 n=1 Tax=Polistes canadensis TaxID=91411 RepID=UPI000718C4AF|nr:PREDICTED: uncharacterized protein LOC106789624 [Polistes canadensis]